MTATREHLAGLELARETLNHWPVTGLAAAKLALEQLITEAQSTHEPVQGEDFCDSHCTWLDHQPGCPMHEPVQAEAVHAGFDKTLLRLREATQVHSRGRGSDMATVIKRDLADLLNDYDRIGASYRDQHKRIMAAAKPDAELVALLKLTAWNIRRSPSCQESLVPKCACRKCVLAGIDAKLAELQK